MANDYNNTSSSDIHHYNSSRKWCTVSFREQNRWPVVVTFRNPNIPEPPSKQASRVLSHCWVFTYRIIIMRKWLIEALLLVEQCSVCKWVTFRRAGGECQSWQMGSNSNGLEVGWNKYLVWSGNWQGSALLSVQLSKPHKHSRKRGKIQAVTVQAFPVLCPES